MKMKKITERIWSFLKRTYVFWFQTTIDEERIQEAKMKVHYLRFYH